MFTTLTHNLGTTDVLVYLTGRREDGQIHNQWYGGCIFFDTDYHYQGVYLNELSDTSMTFWRGADDLYYDQIRVLIWKIPEP